MKSRDCFTSEAEAALIESKDGFERGWDAVLCVIVGVLTGLIIAACVLAVICSVLVKMFAF